MNSEELTQALIQATNALKTRKRELEDAQATVDAITAELDALKTYEAKAQVRKVVAPTTAEVEAMAPVEEEVVEPEPAPAEEEIPEA